MSKFFLILILLFFDFNYAKIMRDPFSYSSKRLISKYKCKAIGKINLTDKKFAIVSFNNHLETIASGDPGHAPVLNQDTVIDILDDRIIVQDQDSNVLQIELEENEL